MHDRLQIEAAARRVYAVEPLIRRAWIFSWKLPWDETDEDYRNYCRRIAAAALNIDVLNKET